MSDAPNGVPVDDSRDGVGAPSRVDVPVADKLRNLADWLDAHPSVRVGFLHISPFDGEVEVQDHSPQTSEDLAKMARTIGGRWEKTAKAESSLFTLQQEVMPGYTLKLVAWRGDVCRKVVTGQREVEVPDPDAPLVKVTEDIVEWRCLPLLGGGA